ncbi:hypothetical protein D3C85_1798610 [compost metagenome]
MEEGDQVRKILFWYIIELREIETLAMPYQVRDGGDRRTSSKTASLLIKPVRKPIGINLLSLREQFIEETWPRHT